MPIRDVPKSRTYSGRKDIAKGFGQGYTLPDPVMERDPVAQTPDTISVKEGSMPKEKQKDVVMEAVDPSKTTPTIKQCQGVTASGKRCKLPAVNGNFCKTHSQQEEQIPPVPEPKPIIPVPVEDSRLTMLRLKRSWLDLDSSSRTFRNSAECKRFNKEYQKTVEKGYKLFQIIPMNDELFVVFSK